MDPIVEATVIAQLATHHNMRMSIVSRATAGWQKVAKMEPVIISRYAADVDDSLHALARAEPFAWTSESIAAVQHEATQSLPHNAALAEAMLPAQYGWWWFDRNYPVLPEVYGLLWSVHQNWQTGNWIKIVTFSTLNPFPWMFGIDRAGFFPCDTITFVLGEPLDRAVERIRAQTAQLASPRRPDTGDAMEKLARFFVAGCHWLGSTLVTEAKPVERHELRRLKATTPRMDVPPIVKVVHLRRVLYPSTERTAPAHIDYACRFEVREHLRHCRSGKIVKIKAHVKGPADKPFRAKRLVVYEVDR